MYWIYLIIFILAVLVPDIVPTGYKIFSVPDEKIEELLIFSFGIIGFLIFRIKEKQSIKNLEEKIKIQKEAHEISRNLNDTYSYIGETNRKLDIMKGLSINLLDIEKIDAKKEKKFFDDLMESIFILGKSKKFIIRFINTENAKTIYELKSRRRVFIRVSNEEIIKNILRKNNSFDETGYHFTIISPREINKTISAIIISKNNQQQKMEDPEMLKALASQSLFLYNYSREKNSLKK